MQSVSSRIWTRVAVSIFFDGIQYTQNASIYVYIYMCVCVCVCVGFLIMMKYISFKIFESMDIYRY